MRWQPPWSFQPIFVAEVPGKQLPFMENTCRDHIARIFDGGRTLSRVVVAARPAWVFD